MFVRNYCPDYQASASHQLNSNLIPHSPPHLNMDQVWLLVFLRSCKVKIHIIN